MKPKNFVKSFCFFFIALLIPLLLLGGFTSYVVKRQSRLNSETSNSNYLHQIRYNMEMILDQINQLSLTYDLNTDVGYQLDLGLQRSSSTYLNNQIMGIIRAFTTAESNSRPYIHSTYVYFNYSDERFFSSSSGITEIDGFLDQEWIESFRETPYDVKFWTQMRSIKRFDFEMPEPVISIYRRTFSRPGVIVLNLKPRYIEEELFASSNTDEMPYILVLNENGEMMLSNKGNPFGDSLSLADLRADARDTITVNGEVYSVDWITSEEYEWTYLAIVPESTLYVYSTQLNRMIFAVLVLCILLGLALALVNTYRNFYQMRRIFQLLQAAETGQPLPVVSTRFAQDEYAVLTENLVKTFVEQHYRKLAYSESIFHRKTLELLALQAQINPHFLFNTLKTIYWKAFSLTNGPNDVSQMLDSLTSLLRYSLDSPHAMVTLKEELTQTRNFLEIQSIRHKDKFEIDIQSDRNAEDVRVLRLIIQPIVENSIQHGILPKEGAGLIRLRIKRNNDMVRITVMDDGVGIEPEHLKRLRQQLYTTDNAEVESQHIGLINTVRRMSLKYGSRFKVRVHSIVGSGTSVSLYIPVQLENEGEGSSEKS